MKHNVKTLKPVRTSTHTLTQAAEHEIRTAIEQGLYRPGAQLPAESELVLMLGVSRTVVRDALRLLEDEGLITRRHGKGTFVRSGSILQNLNFNFGTTEMIRTANMTPGTAHAAAQIAPATHDVATALNIPVDTPVVTIERIRTADQKPVVYSWDYIPHALIGDDEVDVFQSDREDGSLYHLLKSHYGLVIEYGVARVLPVSATPQVAQSLQVPDGSVLLCLLQTDYTAGDEPVLYSCEYHLPDAFDFIIMRKGPRKMGGGSSVSAE
ncbi:MAG TPA: GntR family transcriptional regulator [Anaerolineales bacterium]|nr:GntR family transcriptional regulator [Anaerolineales bacterium]HRF48270.1 GntR family transcriptional regulator [Anaerolineales bacterium]